VVEKKNVVWSVQAHPEFEKWLLSLDAPVRDELLAHTILLERFGPALARPHVDTVTESKYPNMKELRVQFKGNPWRVLFAFDPKRSAILLVGGNKASDKRWYKTHIRVADERYAEHLRQLEKR
jgi:hypothetical protein